MNSSESAFARYFKTPVVSVHSNQTLMSGVKGTTRLLSRFGALGSFVSV